MWSSTAAACRCPPNLGRRAYYYYHYCMHCYYLLIRNVCIIININIAITIAISMITTTIINNTNHDIIIILIIIIIMIIISIIISISSIIVIILIITLDRCGRHGEFGVSRRGFQAASGGSRGPEDVRNIQCLSCKREWPRLSALTVRSAFRGPILPSSLLLQQPGSCQLVRLVPA